MAKKQPTKKSPPKKSKSARRPKQKETAAETVETSEGVQLLLGNMPAAKDAMYHYQTILGLIDKARTASARVSEAKKKAKEANVDVGALMTVMRMERADPLDLASELKMQAMLMSELGLPVQMQLFEPKYGSIDAQAAAEGAQSGKNGRSPDTVRWPEGVPGHTAYMRAWNDEQGEIAKNFGKTPSDDDDKFE